jgi:6-phosphogluconolactonase
MSHAQVHKLDGSEIGAAVAQYVSELATAAIAANGKFTIALSGGSMPKVLGQGLPGLKMEWDKWHVFFSDERCVALDHDDSNYKACAEHFLSKVPIPAEQIYCLDPTLADKPEEAAADYAQKMQSVFGDDGTFDLILLGMGPDGHTASLFPGHALVNESSKYVIIDTSRVTYISRSLILLAVPLTVVVA